MTTILAVLLIWTGAGFVIGPLIGRYLKRMSGEPANHYPFPSGSILDVNHPERVS